MYELIIVGAGPAGLSAALTARARGRQVLMVSNQASLSALARAKQIDNYPGLPEVSGKALLDIMTEQALQAGAELINERVISILPMEEQISLTTGADVFQSRAVILAIGSWTAKPLEGEQTFLGRGVSYCATCDGMFFRGQRVVVIGMSDEAVSEANFLSDIGCDVIFVAPKAPEGLVDLVELHIGQPVAIQGDALGVTAAIYRASAGVSSSESATTSASSAGATTTVTGSPSAAISPSPTTSTPASPATLTKIDCQGVFILRPAIAPDSLIQGLRLEDGCIYVDSSMATSIRGVFAAGDCVGKPLQIAKAVGEGQLAAFSADKYLAALKP
ncbi:MAG: NAD(P)/FAD-dependent oxidoreductase [Coriobacteriales bacterium]|jgi:thioredoxin reductase (NADPH)|nr:NAD(P)/FAD-dependent oxidoreductase [Coriobacteriales bacterium]